MANDDVFVNIVDVVPNTVCISVLKLQDNDIVFDVFGGELPLRRAKEFKNFVRTIRQDGVVDYWEKDSTITVKRRFS